MIFKDIHLFNQALLAKEVWRLLNDHECLLARFLKSRYFANSTFETTALGNRLSFDWRSIIFGKELPDESMCPL